MLFDERKVFMPYEYQEAFNFWERQQQAHWLASEVSMASDITDWKQNLTDSERNIVGNILKSFTQVETIVEDYWANKVFNRFPKPEIKMLANSFANMESIHSVAYSYLNTSLGLIDFTAFQNEKTVKQKFDYLETDRDINSIAGIAKELAIFSAFTEGVQLFSSFMILMSFARFNKLKGVGQIVSFSVKDESLHSTAGCWLFRQIIAEYPDIWTDELKRDIYEAARICVSLEDDFIDKVFELGDIEGITSKQLKTYIRARANTKLNDLGLKNNWKNIDQEILKQVNWFDYMTTGVHSQDFFAGRVVDYSKGNVDFSKIWDDGDYIND